MVMWVVTPSIRLDGAAARPIQISRSFHVMVLVSSSDSTTLASGVALPNRAAE